MTSAMMNNCFGEVKDSILGRHFIINMYLKRAGIKPGPLALQATALTTRPWPLGLMNMPFLIWIFDVTFSLQLKFFYWETGYFNTLDITLDRAGYYLCWGCLCWVQASISYLG